MITSDNGPIISPSRLHYIPITLAIFFPCTFMLCYFIALSLGHIDAFFAFISDAGTMPPEQNVFAQLVNMGAALFAYFSYIRFKQVEQYFLIRFKKPMLIGNVIGLSIGIISAVGMSLVGNFPELIQKEIHLLGAFLTLVGGSIYSVIQGYYTFKMPELSSKCVAYVRTFLGILGIMLYFGANATVMVAFQEFNKVKAKRLPSSEKQDPLRWTDKDGGYRYHAASVIMEWLLIVIFDIFILTFASEFKKFRVDEPKIRFRVDLEVVSTTPPNEAESVSQDETETVLGSGDVPLYDDADVAELGGPPPSNFYVIVRDRDNFPKSTSI